MDIKAALVGAGVALTVVVGGVAAAAIANADNSDPQNAGSIENVVIAPTIEPSKAAPPVPTATPEVAVPDSTPVVVEDAAPVVAPPAPVQASEPQVEDLPEPTVQTDGNGAANGDPGNAGSSE